MSGNTSNVSPGGANYEVFLFSHHDLGSDVSRCVRSSMNSDQQTATLFFRSRPLVAHARIVPHPNSLPQSSRATGTLTLQQRAKHHAKEILVINLRVCESLATNSELHS